MKMQMLVLAALLAALGSTNVYAQQVQADKPAHLSVNFGPGSLTHITAPDARVGEVVQGSGVQPIIVPMAKKPLFVLQGDYTPANRWGGGARFTAISSSGSIKGTVPGTSQVRLWDSNLFTNIQSTSPIDRGTISYSAKSKMSVRRFDGLAIRGFGAGAGYVSIFGGVAYAQLTSEQEVEQGQNFFLHNIPPGRPEDSVGILEVYKRESSATAKFSGLGPTFGAEGIFCPVNRVLLQVRGDIAYFLGSSNSEGNWRWTKTGSLVPSNQGLNATPGANLFPPVGDPFPVKESVKGRITATELEASVRFRVSSSAQIGFGPMWARYSNVPGVASWSVPNGFAPEKGHWRAGTSATLSYWAWTISASMRF